LIRLVGAEAQTESVELKGALKREPEVDEAELRAHGIGSGRSYGDSQWLKGECCCGSDVAPQVDIPVRNRAWLQGDRPTVREQSLGIARELLAVVERAVRFVGGKGSGQLSKGAHPKGQCAFAAPQGCGLIDHWQEWCKVAALGLRWHLRLTP
jgi:hypothetical protein